MLTNETLQMRHFHLRIWGLNGSKWFDFEPHLSALYRAILRPGSVAIDGGANLGAHTFQMAQAVQPDGLVVAIEPVPETRNRLEALLPAYHLPGNLVRLLPYGLSSTTGEAAFYQVLDPVQHALSGLRKRHILENQEVKQIRVELTTLDAVCQDFERLDFIKLDLEGAEMDALRGGRLTLDRFRPVVAFEQDQFSPRYFGYTWDGLLEYFASLNYEIYDLFGLRYTEVAMFEECAMWDFVGLPAEFPDKESLFGSVRRSMENAGIRFDLEDPPAGVSQGHSELASACVLDWIGPICAWAQEPVHLSEDAEIRLSGWALDERNQSVAGGVDIAIDDVTYAAAYGEPRSDVADRFKNKTYRDCGFSLLLPPGVLPKGQHALSVRVISCDKQSHYQGPVLDFTID